MLRLSILDICLTKGRIRPWAITSASAIIRLLLENQHTLKSRYIKCAAAS